MGLGVFISACAVGWQWRLRDEGPGEFRVLSLEAPDQVTVGGKERIRALVHDLRDGRPIAGERVELLAFVDEQPELKLASGVTDAGGEWIAEAQLPASKWSSLTFAAYIVRDGESSARTVSPAGRRAPTTALTTDKPLYQPGQIVHLRALAFDSSARPAAGTEVVFTVSDPNETKVFRQTRKTSEFGIAHADFTLASEILLGDYTVEVAGTQAFARQKIRVERYALPKGKVTLEIEHDGSRPGEAARGTLAAVWSFGKPIVDAKVTLQRSAAGQSPVAEGRTDAKGEYRFVLPPPVQAGALVGVVELEGGTTLEGKTNVGTAATKVRVEAIPESGTLVPGVENRLFVVVSDDLNGPVSATVRGDPELPSAETDANGIAVLSVVPHVGQRWYPVTATTERGQKGTGDAAVHQHGSDGGKYGGGAQVPRPLLIRAAKPVLPAGGSSPMQVLAPEGDTGTVHLALWKGGRLLSTARATANGDVTDVPLAVPPSARGLVIVEAKLFGSGGLLQGQRFLLADGAGDLVLEASTKQSTHPPGSRAALDVTVRGPGGPARVALGLSAVDEAFFALAELRPDLERRLLTMEHELGPYRSRHTDRFGARTEYAPSERVSPDVPGVLEADSDSVRFAALGLLSKTLRSTTAGAWFDVTALPEVAAEQKRRAGGAGILGVGALGLSCIAAFVAFGFWRIGRAPPVPEVPAADRQAFSGAMRRLMFTWLLASALPLVGVLLVMLLTGQGRMFGLQRLGHVVGGTWALVAVACFAWQSRALGGIRSTALAQALPALARVLWLAPAGMLVCHLAIALSLSARLEWLLTVLSERHLPAVLCALLLAVQLPFGVMAMLRTLATTSTGAGRRSWLLLSRASFVGLPLTLIGLGVLAYRSATTPRTRWDFYEVQREEAYEDVDHKEGGTGTRAKGEEGSMGAPRFAVTGPADNPGGVPIRVRSYFPETLLWLPEIVTDPSGRARIEIPLADSITTYRVALSAVSAQGELGSLTLPLVAFQDFFVDVTTPPTLSQGDQVSVPVTVFNYLPEVQSVRLTLESDGFEVRGKPELELALGPNETRGTSFTVRATAAGSRLLRVKAVGKTLSDAVERRLDVQPDGRPRVTVHSGVVGAATRVSFDVPAQAIAGGTSLAVKLYGGTFSQMVEALDGALKRPSGCFEQTSSTTYPNVLVLDYLRRTKASSPTVEQLASAYIDQGYQRLLSFEVSGGGFSWFGGPPSSTVLSAYGLLQFHDMSTVRVVDEAMMQRTRSYLYAAQRSDGAWQADGASGSAGRSDRLVTAYIAWALAQTGESDPRLARALDWLAAAGDDDPYALALTGAALLAGGRRDAATSRAAALAKRVRRGGSLAHWESQERGLTGGYGESLNIEATGLAAQFLAAAGVERELRQEALGWLVSKRDANGLWSSTASTVAALRALLHDAKPARGGNQRVTVRVNGEPVKELTLERGALDVHHLVSLSSHARSGDNIIELEAAKDSDVAYQLVGTHHVPWGSAAAAAAEAPISLRVDYGSRRATPGKTLEVRVDARWNLQRDSGMVLIEVGVPPGFDVLTEALEGLVESGVVARYSISASRVVLYLNQLAQGTPVKLGFRLRALLPVRALAPASVAYAYYSPDARFETRPVHVSVDP